MTELLGNLPPPGGVMESSELVSLVARMERFLAEYEHPLPVVMTRKRAAIELSISKKTLERMVRRGEIFEVTRGGRPGIPASEVRRLAIPKAVKRVRGVPKRGPRPTSHDSSGLRAKLRKLRSP